MQPFKDKIPHLHAQQDAGIVTLRRGNLYSLQDMSLYIHIRIRAIPHQGHTTPAPCQEHKQLFISRFNEVFEVIAAHSPKHATCLCKSVFV